MNKVEVKALVVADNFRNQSLPAILNELIPESERMQANNVVSSPQIQSLQKVITLSEQPQQRFVTFFPFLLMKCRVNNKTILFYFNLAVFFIGKS